jgi:hypothetical protein
MHSFLTIFIAFFSLAAVALCSPPFFQATTSDQLSDFRTGLPDGLFSNKKIPIWVHVGGPENGKCWYVYFMVIWNILWSFGIFYGDLEYLRSFGIFLGHLVMLG